MTSVRKPGSARQSLERLKVLMLGLSRVAGLANVAIALAAGWEHAFDHSATAELALAVTVESALLFVACRRTGRLPSGLFVADVAFSCAGLLVNGLIPKAPVDCWAEFFMYPYTLVTSIMVGVALRRAGSAILGIVLLAASYVLAVLIRGEPMSIMLPNAVSYLAILPVSYGVSRLIERYATTVDHTRAMAESRAAELAAERERSRQARLLHDRVLQTLEALSQPGRLPDEPLRRQVAAEARWLRGFVETGHTEAEDDDLLAALRRVVEAHAVRGLRVELNAAALDSRPLPPPVVEALTTAVYEALTNVAKHSGVTTATVRAHTRQGGVRISVVDAGRGFTATHPGFGLTHSVSARLAEVDGLVTIDSAPGIGTCVELTVPFEPRQEDPERRTPAE